MNRKTLIIVLAVVLFCCCAFAVGAGVAFYLARNLSGGDASGLEPLMLNASDLPSGWGSAEHYYSMPYREGTIDARNDVFQLTGTSPLVYLSHEIFLYPSEQAAALDYQSFHDQEINGVLPPKSVDFTFTPKNPADKFDKFCTDGGGPDAYFCKFVQEHGKYITELRTTFDSKNLTAAQVNDILQKLDAKLP